MVRPPIDIVTVFLCYANYTGPFLYFVEVGLPSGRVGLKFRADGALGPVYALPGNRRLRRLQAGLRRSALRLLDHMRRKWREAMPKGATKAAIG